MRKQRKINQIKKLNEKLLLKKFTSLPKKMQDEFESLHKHFTEIEDEKTRAALELIYPAIMKRFLKKYDSIHMRELELKQKISLFGRKHGFTLQQLLMARKALIDKMFRDYLKKKGMT